MMVVMVVVMMMPVPPPEMMVMMVVVMMVVLGELDIPACRRRRLSLIDGAQQDRGVGNWFQQFRK
jgi:hypothetical protein